MTYKQVNRVDYNHDKKQRQNTIKKKTKATNQHWKMKEKGDNTTKTIEGVSILTWVTTSVLTYVWFFMF